MIGVMFSGRHSLATDEEGYFFVDRDGTHFRYILNFLRNPDEFEHNFSVNHKNELIKEATYYGLNELMFQWKPAKYVSVVVCNLVLEEDGIWYSYAINANNNDLNYGVVSANKEKLNKKPIKVCNSCRKGFVDYQSQQQPFYNPSYFIEYFAVVREISDSQPKVVWRNDRLCSCR
jgi:hypothetical protein